MATEASTGALLPSRLAAILDACGFAAGADDALVLVDRRAATGVWASPAALSCLHVADADAAARSLFGGIGGQARAARLGKMVDGTGFRLDRMSLPGRAGPVVAAWFPVTEADRPLALLHLRGICAAGVAPVKTHVAPDTEAREDLPPTPALRDEVEAPTRVLWESDAAGRLIRVGSNVDVLGDAAPRVGDELPAVLRPIDAVLAERIADAAAHRGSVGRVRVQWPNGEAPPLAVDIGCTAGRGDMSGLRGFLAVHGRAEVQPSPDAVQAQPEPEGSEAAVVAVTTEPEPALVTDIAPAASTTAPESPVQPPGSQTGNIVHFPVMRLGPVPANFGSDLRPAASIGAVAEPVAGDPALDLAMPRWAEAPVSEPLQDAAVDGLSDDERDAFEHIRKVLGSRPFAPPRAEPNPSTIPPGVAALLDNVPLPMRLELKGASYANPLLRDRLGDEALSSRLRDAPEAATTRFDFAGVPASLLILGSDALAPRSRHVPDASEALDLITDGVVRIDEAGLIREVSPKAGRLLGLDEAVLGRAFATLLADGQAPVWQAMAAAASGPEAPSQGPSPLRLRHAGGQPVSVAVRLARFDGTLLCALTLDRAAAPANDTAEAARREAERTSALKSEFLAKVSHEIRTPLNAILGFAEVIRDERLGPVGNARYLEYLRDIHASGTHVMSLVNDLLDLSRIEAGRMDLNLAAVDGNAIVQSCVNTLQPQAHRERVVVRLSLTPRLPPALADERSLRQIVLNLLSNAIKFNEPGGQVIVSTALAGPHAVAIRIRDTGVGMSEAEIEAAMEPFRQISTVNRTGSGLGLPLTKALVEANCASMSIKSTRGEGTLVEVTFPLVEQGSVSLPAE